MLRTLSKKHTLVLVEHDMDVVFTLADRITVMVNGWFLTFGRPEDVRANARRSHRLSRRRVVRGR